MMRFLTFLERRPIEGELLLLLAACAVVLLGLCVMARAPAVIESACSRVAGACRRTAARRGAAPVSVGLLTFVLQAAATGVAGVPAPTVHDEFCYLLSADTFAHGRMTNPTHPLWEHFESFHVIQQPTYAAKYPPLQGLFLALGQLLGRPIIGVWLSMAFANAAVCWMLQQWLPARWALLGGLLLACHPRIFWAWGQSYMGGAAAVLGGALVFGAVRRFARAPDAGMAVVLAIGLGVLANSRPFEGLILSLPVAVLLVWSARPARYTLVPLAITLSITGMATGYYNWRVTGDPLRLPYQVHEDKYSLTPIFLWQEARPSGGQEYRHQALRDFHAGWAMRLYHGRRSASGFAWECWARLKAGWWFFLGPVLSVPLLALPWALKNRWMRFALASCLVLTLGLLGGTWFAPHYAAPMTGLLMLLVIQCLRLAYATVSRRFAQKLAQKLAQAMVGGTLLAWLVLFALSFRSQLPQAGYAWPRHRVELLERLHRDGGKHLIIVRYGPRHSPHCEWVYNEADIDAATVVWARDMGPGKNARLLEHFQARRVWMLEVGEDTAPPTLMPFSGWRSGTRRSSADTPGRNSGEFRYASVTSALTRLDIGRPK